MGRRRPQVVSSSSDDEDDELNPHHSNQIHSHSPVQLEAREQLVLVDEEEEVRFQEPLPDIESVALGSSSGPIQVEQASDGDQVFIDVSDHMSPPSPPPDLPAVESTVTENAISSSGGASHDPVSGVLRGLGLSVRAEWLGSCIQSLGDAVPGFSGFDSEMKAKFCFQQFLSSDMNIIGGGVLPPNVDSMHLVELAGPFVLQVDEVINISCSLRQRYQNAAAGAKRCLKLSMTDGVQRVFGMEYRPIKDLHVLAVAGFKVAIKNVTVRRGLLMLVPEVLEVLGGSVQELEAARQRTVFEINKPPRGKRTRTGVVPPLASRGTTAAWPQRVANDPVETSNSTTQGLQASAPPVAGSETLRRTADSAQPHHAVNNPVETSYSTLQGLQGSAPSAAASGTVRTGGSLVSPDRRNTDEILPDRYATENPISGGDSGLSTSRVAAENNFGSVVAPDIHDVDMADPTEHLIMLSGDKELPFTYVACLSAKWASMNGTVPRVRGKIKCILSGVKAFHFRERTTYELYVYVDDGSLISDILIPNEVVQECIGYSTVEVNAALSSSDARTTANMKRILLKFQRFLADFEGMLVVEINNTSAVPIAIEMTVGCTTSDALSLLTRVRDSSQQCSNDRSDPIILSP